MDHWVNCFDCRHPVVVFMVSHSVKHWQAISMPVFEHYHHDLLWCHSISCYKFFHGQKPFFVDSEGESRNINSHLCCEYALSKNIVDTFFFFFPLFMANFSVMPLILAVFSMWKQGVVGSGLCYVAMSWCVKKRGPVFTAAFSPLVQIMAVMFDIPLLHEQLHLGR